MFNEIELADFDLNLLKIFAALMRERNAGRAAVRLGIGAPAVSMALKRLRGQVGDPLFMRVGTRFEPTERAQKMMRLIGPALAQVHAGLAGADEFDPSVSQRTFCVACSDDIELLLSPTLVKTTLSHATRTRYVVRRANFHLDPLMLERDDIDLAIGAVGDLPKWLSSKLLSSQGMLCLVDGRHVDISQPLTLRAYLETPHVIVSSTGDMRGTLDQAFAALQLHRNVVHSTPYFSVVPAILKSGPSIATLPAHAVLELARIHKLSALKPPCRLGKLKIFMVWHRRFDHDADHVWLRNAVGEALAPHLKQKDSTTVG